MASNSHVIAQCQWQTRFDDQHNATALQNALSQWSNHVLPDLIAEFFDKYCPSTQIWRIDELALDLGTLSLNELDSQLPSRVASALEDALAKLFSEQKIQFYSAKQPKLRIVDKNGSAIDLVRWYLLHGTVPWWDAGYISPLTSVDQQLAEQPNAVANLLRDIGQKEPVRRRIVWQWGEQRTRKVVQVLEPWNANFIQSYADNLLNAQQQNITVSVSHRGQSQDSTIPRDSDFKNQLWYWILTHLLVERGSLFNTQQFVRSTLWQMAQHYQLDFSVLLQQLSDVAQAMQASGLIAPQFLQVLITLKQDEQLAQQPTAQPQAEQDFWAVLQRLLHTRQAHHTLTERSVVTAVSLPINTEAQQRIHVSELFVRLAHQDAPRTAKILKQEGASDAVREFLVTQLNNEQLGLVVEVIAPREQRFIMTHVAHTQRFLAAQRVQPMLIWQVLLAYLLVNTGSYFNRRQFVQVTLSDISRKQRIDYQLLLALLVQAPVQQHINAQHFELLAILQELQKQQDAQALQQYNNWQQLSQYLLHGNVVANSKRSLEASQATQATQVNWQQALQALISIQPAHSPKSLLSLLRQHVLPAANVQKLAARFVAALTHSTEQATAINLGHLRQLLCTLSPQHGARGVQLLHTFLDWQQQARLPQLSHSSAARHLATALVQSLLQSITPTRSASQWLQIFYEILAQQSSIAVVKLKAQIQQNTQEDSATQTIDSQLVRFLESAFISDNQLLLSYVHIQNKDVDTEEADSEYVANENVASECVGTEYIESKEQNSLHTQRSRQEDISAAKRNNQEASAYESGVKTECITAKNAQSTPLTTRQKPSEKTQDLVEQPQAQSGEKYLIRATLEAARMLASQSESARLHRVSELVAELMQRHVRRWQSNVLQNSSQIVRFILDALLEELSDHQQWYYLQLIFAGLFGRVFASPTLLAEAISSQSASDINASIAVDNPSAVKSGIAQLQRHAISALQQQLLRAFTLNGLSNTNIHSPVQLQQKSPVLHAVWHQLLQQPDAPHLIASLSASQQGQQWLAAFLPSAWKSTTQQRHLINNLQQLLADALAQLPSHAKNMQLRTGLLTEQLTTQLKRVFWQKLTQVWQQQIQQNGTSARLPATEKEQADWLVDCLLQWATQQQVSQPQLVKHLRQSLNSEAIRHVFSGNATQMQQRLKALTQSNETLSHSAVPLAGDNTSSAITKHGLPANQAPTVRLQVPQPTEAPEHSIAESSRNHMQTTDPTLFIQDQNGDYLSHEYFGELLRHWLAFGTLTTSSDTAAVVIEDFSIAKMFIDLQRYKPQLLARNAQLAFEQNTAQQASVFARLQQQMNYVQLLDLLSRINAVPSAEVNTLHSAQTLLTHLNINGVLLREKQQWLQQILQHAWLENRWQLLSPEALLQQLAWHILNSGACSAQRLIELLQQPNLPSNQQLLQAIETVIEQLQKASQIQRDSITPTASASSSAQAVANAHDSELREQLAAAVQAQRERESSQQAIENAEPVEFPVAINNAGLALISSFFRPLFERLQLTENDKFISPAKQRAAVHYLQFLATGQTHTEEHHLLFNKLLCGLSPTQPIEAGVELTQEEIDTVHGLVEAVINYWSAIGRSSVEGFRGNWIVRNGTLTEAQDHWDLIVEKRSYDVLINRSPLSFSIIKLPWMNKPIYVTWPT